jgi:hypothetical protein
MPVSSTGLTTVLTTVIKKFCDFSSVTPGKFPGLYNDSFCNVNVVLLSVLQELCNRLGDNVVVEARYGLSGMDVKSGWRRDFP